MSEKQAYQDKVQAQLDEWGAEIDKLRAKADKAESELRLEYHKEIDEIKAKRNEVEKKFNELKASSGNAWEDIKGGIQKASDSISDALSSAVTRFN